jgi:hypothetical protein
MKKHVFWVALLLLSVAAFGQLWKKEKMAGARMMKGTDVQWAAGPPSLPPGAKLAVLDGDPGKPGPFTIRLRVPNGYKVMPHWHPTAEQLTVISGTFIVGTGDKWNDSAMTPLGPGSFMTMDAKNRHFAMAKGVTTVQVSSTGPFVVNYVNPADDPSKATAATAAAAPTNKKK